MDGQPQQQPTSFERSRVEHVRFFKDELQELMRHCEDTEEVVVAVRIFPSDEYQWQYPRALVAVARARLEASGRATELKTVMDNKQSRIVLIASEPVRCAVGEVQASVSNAASGKSSTASKSDDH